MPVPNRTIFLHKCSIAVPFVTGRLLAAATAVNGTSRNFIMIRASEHTVAFFWVKASLVSKASTFYFFTVTSVFCCCLPSPRCMTNCIGANISANSINYFRYFLSSLVVMNKQKHKFERLTYDRLNIWSFEWLKVWKTCPPILSAYFNSQWQKKAA